jgi:phytoene/squalene synthetase
MDNHTKTSDVLATSITRAASKQTYYTVNYLVDRDRINDAFRAYAYFRWVDDCLDEDFLDESKRTDFISRQVDLLDRCKRGDEPCNLTPEERFLFDLIKGDHEKKSGLHQYLLNMMAVMTFDANRRGRLIAQDELNDYTHSLAVAVTEALHYFIGHNCYSPQEEARYHAATAAHITHMLRDMLDDVTAGYFNLPREFLESHEITPWDVHSDAYRSWVKDRVHQARVYFASGKEYLEQVENIRCRIAGYAYISRFEGVLDTIERQGYLLQPDYSECKGKRAILKASMPILSLVLNRRLGIGSRALTPG